MKVEIKLLRDNAKIPEYATEGSAACDLASAAEEDIVILPRETKLVPTGIAVGISDKGVVALIYARSGISVKRGLAPANCVGVIDSDYRGEIFVPLRNNSPTEQSVKPGERIAQLMFTPVLTADFCQVDELNDTARGIGGFGSTGKAEYSILTELKREERPEMLKILNASFPESERRTDEKQLALFDDPRYRVLAVRSDGSLAGFMAYWELGDIVFYEHFAVKEELRGAGIGRRALKELLAMHEGKRVVLECEERDLNDIAARRVRFYESLGFAVNDQLYKQPPYTAGGEWLRLHLLSHGSTLQDDEFSDIKTLLYDKIYGIREKTEN